MFNSGDEDASATPTAAAAAAVLDPSELLSLAESHLRRRNFSVFRKYSLEVISSTSTPRSLRTSATQILTISDVLSADNNHYAVLQLDNLSDNNNNNIVRTHFKKLSFILHSIKNSSPLARESLQSLQRAFDCLSDPAQKARYDAHLLNCMAVSSSSSSSSSSGFWTFCPYCFYVYEYDRVYEGCSLRCHNSGCRRVFDAVALTCLPKMELDKGCYFGCFGFFPMGFSPGKDGANQTSKFQSWSPIVGMFPPPNTKPPSTTTTNDTDFIEIESDESESAVPSVDADRSRPPRGMRRKSVAVNARRKRRNNDGDAAAATTTSSFVERLFSDEGTDFGQDFGMDSDRGGRGDVGDLNEGDMAFFEGDGEIFVGLGNDD